MKLVLTFKNRTFISFNHRSKLTSVENFYERLKGSYKEIFRSEFSPSSILDINFFCNPEATEDLFIEMLQSVPLDTAVSLFISINSLPKAKLYQAYDFLKRNDLTIQNIEQLKFL